MHSELEWHDHRHGQGLRPGMTDIDEQWQQAGIADFISDACIKFTRQRSS